MSVNIRHTTMRWVRVDFNAHRLRALRSLAPDVSIGQRVVAHDEDYEHIAEATVTAIEDGLVYMDADG